MAKNSVTDWDENDNNNKDIGGTNIDEGCPPSSLNNAIRKVMSQVSLLEGDDTLASGATADLGTVPGRYVTVSGTTTITGLGTVKAGTLKFVRFSGTLTLTHNATSLVLPGAANITTAAGDVAVMVSEGGGNWRCLSYQRANGQPLVPSSGNAVKTDARRNRVVNHDMRVSQENGTTAGTTNGRYPVDQWAQYFVTSAGVLTVQQVASVTPAGSPSRLRATVTTADASLAAGEYWTLSQNLEGSNVADLRYGTAGAFQSVLRFGFRGPAGTYAVALHNSGATRSYVALYTIAAGQANTDTVQTIAIPGDTTGTWLTADGVIGITLDIVLAAGTTFQGVAGWQAGNVLGTSAVSNGMASAGAIFELFDVGLRLDPDATGVYGQYEVGEVHPDYNSRRYVRSLAGTALGVAYTATYLYTNGGIVLSPRMAKAPVPSNAVYSVNAGALGTPGFSNIGVNVSPETVGFYNAAGNWTVGAAVAFSSGFLLARLS